LKVKNQKEKTWKFFLLSIISIICFFLIWCNNIEKKEVNLEILNFNEKIKIDIKNQNEKYYNKVLENNSKDHSIEIQNIEDKKSIKKIKKIKENLENFYSLESENNNKFLELIVHYITELKVLYSKAILAQSKQKTINSIKKTIETYTKIKDIIIEMNKKLTIFKESREWELNFLIDNNDSFYIQYWEMVFKNKNIYTQYDRIYKRSVDEQNNLIDYNNYFKQQWTLIFQEYKKW